MKLLGQIFIVLIMIMSVAFMGLMFSVNSAHTNWQEAEKKAKESLQKVQGELAAEKAKLEEQKKAFASEVQDKENAIVALSTKVVDLQRENAQLAAARNALETQQATVIASIQSVHDTLAKSREEMTQLRTLYRTAQREFAQKLTELAKKSEEAQGHALTLASLKDIGRELSKQYADAIEVLRKHDLKPVPSMYSGVPPTVDGLVTEVRPGNGGNSMIEISIGEDDGLLKGHQLYVYRTAGGKSSLLGKVEVVATEPNKSACKVLSDFRQGNIQRDDNVATKIL